MELPMQLPETLPPAKTLNVHVGYERYAGLTWYAIEVSHRTGIQITASQFAQYLIDHFAALAAQQLVSENTP